MCQFVSYIEMPSGDVKFLTGKQVFETERGKKLQKEIDPSDLCGHLAIRKYYRISEGMGKEKECTGFSTPDNFPPAIVEAIKEGEMRGMGLPVDLLTAEAYKRYQEATAEAHKRWREAKAEAYKRWREAKADVFWDLFAIPENRNPNWR